MLLPAGLHPHFPSVLRAQPDMRRTVRFDRCESDCSKSLGGDVIGSQTSPARMTVAYETQVATIEVCAKRGCVRSIALADDRGASIETLRQVNIDEDIIRFINLKK